MATKIFWALGYNQVESFLTTFDPKKMTIDPKASIRRPNGKRTPFKEDDINEILEQVAKNTDGSYRVIAGRLLPGKILGGFLFQGTRPDDPNDSSRTSTGASFGRCGSSVPGPTSRTSRRPIPSTRSRR